MKQCRIKDYDLFDYFLLEPESIEHLFCECDMATIVREEILYWLHTQEYKVRYFTDVHIVLGNPYNTTQ